jgi:hypothetical protein
MVSVNPDFERLVYSAWLGADWSAANDREPGKIVGEEFIMNGICVMGTGCSRCQKACDGRSPSCVGCLLHCRVSQHSYAPVFISVYTEENSCNSSLTLYPPRWKNSTTGSRQVFRPPLIGSSTHSHHQRARSLQALSRARPKKRSQKW